ncbi:ABC transporter permease [Chromohalobacter sp. TMW 2.2308]|uniref:ABC transporter permease n=2 Tax=Chromohalobacter TaxID=42054 RepID=A0A9X3B4E8_9GAMM|nr:MULTISPECIES: ABC transporter permease [Chromohalobacter]CDQ36634.1 Glycine betaine/carnitine/choline transport system permease protein OpuCB [Virgibacillus halodenitrificans]MCK2043640.1 ABC transporter permease [Chromohalobacter moromii]MCK2046674.1 ABC transporter permease [Chromohalobacter moromii]MCT8506250.1 ABC transporter permease [Chromohalobacter moromii]MCT8516235.1 ABC transporter permease [Chromohalobacter sp. TMW 2.2271]
MPTLNLAGAGRLLVLVAVFLAGVWSQSSGVIDDFIFYLPDVHYLAVQHLWLTVMSGGLAILVAIPLGIWLSRPSMARVAESMMQVLNVGTTIPTLAVLALSMSFLGIGTVPAVFGLFVATLLPIARNTYTGLKGVDPALKEAAAGIGMSPTQRLLRVELPNALYVIFAGIRTALAINIGTVPLAFLIGAGGLGELIFTGIDLYDPVMMLSGAIPTALLAVVVDMLIAITAFVVVPRGVNPGRA